MGQTIAIPEVSAMSDDLHQTASGKRRDVISWDEFFMSVAIAAHTYYCIWIPAKI